MSKHKHPKPTHEQSHHDHEKHQENHDEVNVVNEEVTKLKEENQRLHDTVLRLSADIQNMERRHKNEIQNVKDYSITDFAKDLLNVIDTFERALQLQNNLDIDHNDKINSIFEGIKMNYNIFEGILKKYGIEKIFPQNEQFNHDYHHAITQVTSPEHQDDEIVQVVQVGYMIKDRILRPAMVIVNKL